MTIQMTHSLSTLAAGKPGDIGPMIAALVFDENRWVNGQRIEVSGGMAL
jgi:NAD(P)-dependent dehydrogenase (short-subunit alcohol dehydrogenase family)